MSTARRRQLPAKGKQLRRQPLPANGLQLIGDIVPGLSLRVDIENRFQNKTNVRLELTFMGGINGSEKENAKDQTKKDTYQAITNLIEEKRENKNNALKDLEKNKKNKFNELMSNNALDNEDAKNLIKKSEKNKISYANFKEEKVGNNTKIIIEDFEIVEKALETIIKMREEFLIHKRIEEKKIITEDVIKPVIEPDRFRRELICFKDILVKIENYNQIKKEDEARRENALYDIQTEILHLNAIRKNKNNQEENIENCNTNPKVTYPKVTYNDSKSNPLWDDIKSTLSQLPSSNPSLFEKNIGLKKIINLAKEGTMNEEKKNKLIRKECKSRSEFCNRLQEYAIPNFFDLKNARDPLIDLLYRSIANLEKDSISPAWMGKYNIVTLEQLMITLQKLDVIKEINAEISRLQFSFGDEHLLLEKIAAYESLKRAIRNSDINESIQDIFKKDIIIGIETILNKKRFLTSSITSSTSGKKLQELRRLPDPRTLVGTHPSLTSSSSSGSPRSSIPSSPFEKRQRMDKE